MGSRGFGFGFGYGFMSNSNQARYNPDAQDYFDAAGITSVTEKNAVSAWASSTQTMRNEGDIIAAYLISPTSFPSSLYCFIRLTQATYTTGNAPNWSPTDGWDFNGVNSFLNSLINASSGVPLNNGGLAVWSLDDTAIAATAIGCTTGASDRFTFGPENASNVIRFGSYDLAGTLQGTSGNSAEFFAGYVLGASSRKTYRAQVETATSAAAVAGTPPNYTLYMGANNNAGTANSFGLRRLGAVFITRGLNATKHNTLESATRTYLTAIGRI